MAGINIVDEIKNIPLGNAISEGLLSGRLPFAGYSSRRAVSIIPQGSDIWTGTAVILPVPPEAGEQISVVSDSDSDVNAGTGINTLLVNYLDANGDAQTETVTMNGTTPVNLTDPNVRFIQDMHSAVVGSNGVAEGNVTIYRTSDSSAIYQEILEGGNMSLNTMRMVPRGYTMFLTSWRANSVGGKPVEIRIRSTSHHGVKYHTEYPGAFIFIDDCFLQDSNYSNTFPEPYEIPELSLIKVTAWSDFVGSYVSASWNGYLKLN
jgi:hypothetical protein